MKALTLHQPYATAIAIGLKQYETRPRRLNYRGPLAIHAGKKPVNLDEFAALNKWLPEQHRNMWPKEFVYGAVIAVADMVGCIEQTQEVVNRLTPTEYYLGHWAEGRFAYILENVRPLSKPYPCNGAQGLWNLDDALLSDYL